MNAIQNQCGTDICLDKFLTDEENKFVAQRTLCLTLEVASSMEMLKKHAQLALRHRLYKRGYGFYHWFHQILSYKKLPFPIVTVLAVDDVGTPQAIFVYRYEGVHIVGVYVKAKYRRLKIASQLVTRFKNAYPDEYTKCGGDTDTREGIAFFKAVGIKNY